MQNATPVLDGAVQALADAGVSASDMGRLTGANRATASRWLQGSRPKAQARVPLRRAARLARAWPSSAKLPFRDWLVGSAALLDDNSPAQWIAAGRPDAPLADWWAEATGASIRAMGRAFSALKLPDVMPFLAPNWKLGIELEALSQNFRLMNPSILSAMAGLDTTLKLANQSVLSMVTAFDGLGVQAALSVGAPARMAAELLRNLPSLYAGMAPHVQYVQEAERSLVASLATIGTGIGASDITDRFGLLGEIAHSFTDLGIGAWADLTLAPFVAAGLDASPALLPAFNREGIAYEAWARAVEAPVQPSAKPSPTRTIRVHVTTRATIATLPQDWRERSDASAIGEAAELLIDARLGLDLEVPGTGLSLEELLGRYFPETLAGLRGMVAMSALPIPNAVKMSAFSFRDALRAFARELTGQPSHGDARTAIKHIVSAQLTSTATGEYLEAAIVLLHHLYKPVGEAVYGHGGDRASLNAWLQSASAAMTAILEAWWVARGPGGNSPTGPNA